MSPPTPRLRRALLVLTAVLAAQLCALTPLPAAAHARAETAAPADTTRAHADGPAGWTARPAGPGADRDARPYVYLEGTPGTALQDRLAVTNSGRDPLTVRLRGDGRAGAWIGFAADTVTVPARTRAEVPLALTVPPDAVPGDASGWVVADDGDEEIRVPVRVRIGGPTLAALTVEDVEISGGTIRYALVNRGNAMLEPRLEVRADGMFGTLLDRPERPLPLELAPGRRVERTEPWPDAPLLDTVTVRLRVTAPGGARDEAEASATYVPVAPAVGAGLLVLGALALLGSGAYRRRRVRPGDPEPAAAESADDRRPTTETRPSVKAGPLVKAGAES
ncbi:hypothetical protein [Streptomyces sp. VB1]|uniref:COG1470 family protein n=1 Tax=Streptomyces sp. VB1 TaxID=2986803 RepID=UPI0022420964|nr:hypothetical protein [Streptomyces sp. VB1]UZI30818.1 hypothetical protein OH133_23435 [Streptomyces sp. VB1]